MILRDIRYLVGIHLADKGLDPTILAPVLNILNIIDTHLSTIGITIPPEIAKEADRLNYAIVLMNQEEEDEDEELGEVDEEEDDEDEDSEEEEEDDNFIDPLYIDEDEDEDDL